MSSLLGPIQVQPLKSDTAFKWNRVWLPSGFRRFLPAFAIFLVLVWWRGRLLILPLPLYDFMTYWAAARLFLSGSNPYSSVAMAVIEHSLGWQYAQPLVMLNPPWALPIVAPLGLLPFHVARYAWLVLSITLEAMSAIALWQYFGGEKRKQWIALALLAAFLPAGTAEHMGQVTPLILAGLTGLLVSLRRRQDLLASVFLLTLGLKPHLLYLVLLAIVLWTIQAKKWSFLLASIILYVCATISPILYNRNVLQYFGGTVHAAMDTASGFGGALRSVFGIQHAWLQLLPMILGIAWFTLYWIKNHRGWTWEQHLPLVLLVSLSTAPYFWAHDFVLAMPALIALAVAVSRSGSDWLIESALYLLVQIAIAQAGLLSKAWMAAASLLWLVLYQVGIYKVTRAQAWRMKSMGEDLS